MRVAECLGVALIAAGTAAWAPAQTCTFSIGGLNRARTVSGPVHAECPGSVHSAPFGNWGASSPFGGKRNGHQFDGWCYRRYVCDNWGSCRTDCKDGWYEWNSCTDHPRYQPPNCSLYNSQSCTQQASTMGVNVLGTIYGQVASSCPSDTNGDGYCDAGGCKDFPGIWLASSHISLYELDPFGTDELVQTVYFPSTWIPLNCSPWGCSAAGSQWVKPNLYDSPSWPAKVSAEFAMATNWGTYSDPSGACANLARIDPKYNCR
jgi:hypothetical protein